MKKNQSSFLKISALIMLIAVIATTFISCEQKDDVQGAEITITVDVTKKSGETITHEIKTTATNLGSALVESGIVEDNQDDYGLYILTVDGETADYSVDGSYWAISKNGEYLMTGASQTDIADGEHYELVYTVYSE